MQKIITWIRADIFVFPWEFDRQPQVLLSPNK